MNERLRKTYQNHPINNLIHFIFIIRHTITHPENPSSQDSKENNQCVSQPTKETLQRTIKHPLSLTSHVHRSAKEPETTPSSIFHPDLRRNDSQFDHNFQYTFLRNQKRASWKTAKQKIIQPCLRSTPTYTQTYPQRS